MVTLGQGPLEACSGITNLVFHVKHTPVQKAASLGRLSGQKLETICIQNQQRKFVGKAGDRPRVFAGHAQHCTPVLFSLDAEAAGRTRGKFSLSEDDVRVLAVLYLRADLARTEGSRRTQDVGRLEKTCLAASIHPEEQVMAGKPRKTGLGEVAKVRNCEFG